MSDVIFLAMYIYIYMPDYIDRCTYTICIRTHMIVHIYVYVYMHTYIYIYIYLRVLIYFSIYMFVYRQDNIIYIYTYLETPQSHLIVTLVIL